jgi:putative flippase GtrA
MAADEHDPIYPPAGRSSFAKQSRLFWFAAVSGTGWVIDFGAFYLLVAAGNPTGLSNVMSATVAVTFVFFTSTSSIFKSTNGFILYKFFTYLVYQAVAIVTASWAIQALSSGASLSPLMAKAIVTPLTFYANFQFMSVLTTGKLRLQ